MEMKPKGRKSKTIEISSLSKRTGVDANLEGELRNRPKSNG
jgi:hypothetical protein